MALSIPPYDRWLELTAVTMRTRSSDLKAVDAAIKQYGVAPSDANAGKIRSTWAQWKNVKGDGWKSNDRNKKGALTKLDDEMAKIRVGLNKADKEALLYIDEQRRMRYRQTFTGKTVKMRRGSAAMAVVSAADQFKKAIGAGQKVGAKLPSVPGGGKVASGLSDLFGIAGGLETIQGGVKTLAVMAGATEVSRAIDAVIDCVPGLSLIKGGAEVVLQWGRVVSQFYDQRQMGKHAYAMNTGAATAAFTAVIAMMERDLRFQVSTATTATASFAAKAATSATGYGAIADPFIGAAKQAAELIQNIVRFAIEVREMQALQAILKDPSKINLEAFSICPMFGAYMLCTSDTSDLLSMLVSEFGQADWMSNIEKVVKKDLEPVLAKASEYVQGSPYVIEGVPMHRKQNKTGWDKLSDAAKDFMGGLVG